MIGHTNTIPLEILLAAGHQPRALSSLILNDENPRGLFEEAELAGFPSEFCGWTKGFYAAALRHGVRELVVVTEGGYDRARALVEMLSLHGVHTIPFAYPYDRSPESLALEIKKLARHFGASPVQINQTRQRLNVIRQKVHEIDRLTWEENRVSGGENNQFLYGCADMNGDPDQFELTIDSFLNKARKRQVRKEPVRLACVGSLCMAQNLFAILEELGSRVVFNEMARQISMPVMVDSLVEQYLKFTPVCSLTTRLGDIAGEVEKRRVHGIIHCVPSHRERHIDDMILRRQLKRPVLTLAADRPGAVDAATRTRLEGFISSLRASL